ncbi:MAG: hypothetical protein CFH35_01587, partial [Alphaproteobacteria bacterium MarineAlpha9_Bin5]
APVTAPDIKSRRFISCLLDYLLAKTMIELRHVVATRLGRVELLPS